ncbi:gametocyte-specific factor 1 [Denticeps clupeoides]|uniref:CHHC U11-48K-type domain-containing protein n=1 Tax=Denticeps clupeoides TaxID=299321 RepID=A0AAY4DEJ8_9TELE|nr:gametocyte-specific factor 1-like [Denticeps clupeoides]
MATFRFGTSCGPSSASSNGQAECEWTNGEEPSDIDPNKFVQCPYDKSHSIRAGRFPFHLIKCSKNHPKLASELQACPFNARHRFPNPQMARHVADCPDRPKGPEELDHAEVLHKFQVPVNTWANPASEEDWENEADDMAPTFVWGVSTNQVLQSRPTLDTTNNLAPGLRAPRNLPWQN